MAQWEDADGWGDAGWEDANTEASFSEGVGIAAKQGLAGVGNTVDRAWSGLAGALANLFSPEEADKVFKGMEERVKSRNDFAKSDKKVGVGSRLVGSLPSLPSQVLTFPFSPFETGQRSLELGEDMKTAQINQAIRGAGNAAAIALPASVGTNIGLQSLSGAGMNFVQDYVTGNLIADNSKTDEAKKEFTPTKEDLYQSALLGALLGPMAGKRPEKTKSKVAEKLAEIKPETKPVEAQWEQAELPLENSAQQIAEMRAAQQGQMDLFGPVNEAQRVNVAPVDPRTMPGIETVRQAELFDQPEMGRVANPYEAALGDWRIDENGIPVKVDLSMEAQNLENPLQRNLWGDELEQRMNPVGQNATLLDQNGLQQGIPLTEAIDSMPWIDKRAAINRELKGDVTSTPQLDAAIAEANRQPMGSNSPKLPSSQRGAINMDVFDPAFKVMKELANGIRLVMRGTTQGPVVRAIDPEGKVVGEATFSHDTWARPPRPTDNLEAGWVTTDPKKTSAAGLDADRLAPTTKSQYPGLATEMYKFAAEQGNDIVRSGAQTPEGKAMWDKWEQKGIAKNGMIKQGQRGGIDFKAITDSINDAVEKVTGKIKPPATKEDAVGKLPGMGRAGKDLIYVPEAGVLLAEQAKAQADGPPLFESLQAGLDHASEKTGSVLMKGAAQWLQYARRIADFGIREQVIPLEKSFKKLTNAEMVDLMEVNRMEMFNRKQFTEAELRSAGMNDKQMAAYKQFRDAQAAVLDVQNKARAAIGKEPITPQNAYLSSVFQGDYHIPVRDKAGNLVWYIQQPTKGEAKAAIKWLQENAKDLDVADLKVEYKPRPFADIPRDVMGAYQEALKMFPEDDPVAQKIRSIMEEYATEKGNRYLAQNLHHVDKKANVRGFMGDNPWLDPVKNAYNQAHAQIGYMKDAYRWAHMQEALTQLKPLLSDPELIKNQPNNMGLTKAYVLNNMGISKNLMKGLENYLGSKFGQSSSLIPGTVRDLKGIAYMVQLGASVGYMVATPFQLIPGLAAWHTELGLNPKNFYRDLPLTLSDGIIGIYHDIGKDATGGSWDSTAMMSDFGKTAYRWAEANGVFSANLFDENAGLGAHKVLAEGQNLLGYTISKPDQMSRWISFLSFARRLETSGKYKGNPDAMFQRAAELTEHVATDMHRQARPLIVDKFGSLGEAAYMYRAPQVNMLNTLSIFARKAMNGNPAPFLMYMTALGVMGGVLNLPGVSELDQSWELIKEGIAKYKPEWYKHVEGTGIKHFVLSNLDDANTFHQVIGWGAPSVMTGANMASRFSQEVVDVSNPLSAFSPLAEELSHQGATLKAMINPNQDTFAGAARTMLPPLGKGLLESYHPSFKSGVAAQDGSWTGYRNPNKVEDPSTMVKRSPQEEDYKKLGLTALSEGQRRTKDYITNQENARVKKAQDAAMDNLWNAVRRQDETDITRYVKTYFELGGDSNRFMADLNVRVQKLGMTPSEFKKTHIRGISTLMDVVRRMEMDKGNQ